MHLSILCMKHSDSPRTWPCVLGLLDLVYYSNIPGRILRLDYTDIVGNHEQLLCSNSFDPYNIMHVYTVGMVVRIWANQIFSFCGKINVHTRKVLSPVTVAMILYIAKVKGIKLQWHVSVIWLMYRESLGWCFKL